MLLGIISDTHDDMEAIKRAVSLFNEKGVSYVLHAGDIISPFTFEVFCSLKADFMGIFGNNDGDRLLLTKKSDGRLSTQPLITEIDGKKIALIHEPDIVEPLIESKKFDIIIYGHTHKPDIREKHNTIVLNPGKAARLHKGDSTVAILDTKTKRVEILRLFE